MKTNKEKPNYLKPLSIQTVFKFTIKPENLNFILGTIKNSLFEKITMQTDYRGVRIEYTISTTVQKVSFISITPSYIERTEKRFRNEFFKRIQSLKSGLVDYSQKTSIQFCSYAYTPR